jgi:uncharacterized protein YlxW (UPF0749 family)
MSFRNSKWWPIAVRAQPAPSTEKVAGLEDLEHSIRHLDRVVRRQREQNFDLEQKIDRLTKAVNRAEHSVDLADEYIEELALGSNTFHESEAEKAYTADRQSRIPVTRAP